VAGSPKMTATKKIAFILLLASLIVPCILKAQPAKATFNINTVELPREASPSPSPSPSPTPSPTATPIPTDMKPLPTTLLVAVAILACVFGFGLIVNLATGKKKEP
jgi:hypothetical protein